MTYHPSLSFLFLEQTTLLNCHPIGTGLISQAISPQVLCSESERQIDLSTVFDSSACSVPRGRPGIRGLVRELKGIGATHKKA